MLLNTVLSKNYNFIIRNFLSYLPSRLLVVVNSLIIVPVLAHLMRSHEIGVFQLAIGILNLVCTCSTDWITKSALRFYEKYRGCGELDKFFSNLIWLALIVYFIIIMFFFFSAGYAAEKLFISEGIFFLTLFLVIPAGIRQFLYQMLRVLNRPFLYTFSIIIYQLSLLALFLLFSGIVPNVYAMLISMACAMFFIDFYLLREINLRISLRYSLDKSVLYESLKYALPQIVTNTSIWGILHINKFIFQYNQMFEDTAAAGIAWLLVTSVLTPVFSAFLFAVFPAVVKKFETKDKIKPIMTNTIRLYCMLFIPVAALFCFYCKDITQVAFASKYPDAYIIIAFSAVTLFFHELMKLFNIKYHLKNKTYIETAVTFIAGFVCLTLNLLLIPEYHLLGAGLSMFLSIILLFVLNIFVQFKDMDYVSYFRIAKTGILSLFIGIFSFIFIELLCMNVIGFNILRMSLYLFLCYILSFAFAKQLLK